MVGSMRWMLGGRLAVRLIGTGMLAAACTLNRPAPDVVRPGPEATTVSAVPRDTVFARALAALREQGFTEISADAPAGQVRGKSRDGVQVRITITPAGDSTMVRIATEGEVRGAGMDSEAMATVLAIASAISAPKGARPAAAARADSAKAGTTRP